MAQNSVVQFEFDPWFTLNVNVRFRNWKSRDEHQLSLDLLWFANKVWSKAIFTVRNEVAKVMFLQASVHGGVCLSAWCDTPPREQTPPGADTPWEQTPPIADPLEQTPPRTDTPGADTPWSRHPIPGADTSPGADTPPEQTPPEQTPPGADTPLPGADTSPGSRHPHSRHPPEQTPPEHTPQEQTHPQPPEKTPPGSRHPPSAHTPAREMATAVDGTHPTGMHSCFTGVCQSFCPRGWGGFCMMSLPVWLLGPMFLRGGGVCAWSHVPSRWVSVQGILVRGVSVQGVSVWGVSVRQVSLTETPWDKDPHVQLRAGGTHLTGMLSCLYLILLSESDKYDADVTVSTYDKVRPIAFTKCSQDVNVTVTFNGSQVPLRLRHNSNLPFQLVPTVILQGARIRNPNILLVSTVLNWYCLTLMFLSIPGIFKIGVKKQMKSRGQRLGNRSIKWTPYWINFLHKCSNTIITTK